ncbi:hypothetical protein ACSBPH_10485 [Microbacterium sp. F51-2R]|uniref:hypothetical protein n=1 Tax=Microbacterium sp. F51-2R TaxID=3445777 RepID=UPI003FA01506
MKIFLSRALWGVLIAGGITIFGAAAANAAETNGDDGLLSGTQAIIDVNLPVTVGGNAVSVIGDSTTSAPAPAPASAPAPAPASGMTSGEDGVASGSQAIVNVDVPINVQGVAVSGVGDATTSSAPAAPAPAPAPVTVAAPATSGEDGIGSGTQALVSVNAPVTVTGNAVSVVGDSTVTNGTTGTTGGSTMGSGPSVGSPMTSGEDGILGGTQVIPVVNAPVTVTGNAVSVIGDSTVTNGTGTAGSTTGSGPSVGSPTTSGEDGILGGTQVIPVVNAPVTVTGNAISGIGDSTVTGGTAGWPMGSGPSVGSPTTSGEDGILGGTQVIPVVNAPVTVTGNAISVIGDSTVTNGTGTAGGSTTGSGPSVGSPTTSGEDGILGGTQIIPVINAPATIGGNAISVIGDSTVTGPTGPVVPTDPTDPTDPAGPTEPTSPTGPTEPTGPSGPSVASTDDTAVIMAATGSKTLASTGGEIGLTGLLLGFILAGAGALALMLRRRTA